jgi:hypothetical protein
VARETKFHNKLFRDSVKVDYQELTVFVWEEEQQPELRIETAKP